ncbi:MAG: 1-acyl-sn-glycerol-3-phosphate acyltransferase [Hyphomicrobiales bacterium]
MGWKIIGVMPHDVKKSVIVAAPHTSNWDFIIGRIAFYIMRINVGFLIKKESFVGPLGFILKKMGAIPVDRRKNNRMIDQIKTKFDQSESFHIIITPEGTRSLVKNWRKGYYHIATSANVPIALSYMDYKKKEGGIKEILFPSGDYEKDFEKIKEAYKGVSAKYPEKFNLSSMYREEA